MFMHLQQCMLWPVHVISGIFYYCFLSCLQACVDIGLCRETLCVLLLHGFRSDISVIVGLIGSVTVTMKMAEAESVYH